MKGEVDSLVNFPIDTSLKTIAHSALGEREMVSELVCASSSES